MNKNSLKYILQTSFVLIFLLSGCAEQFSSEFKDDKKYQISEQDQRACLMLSSQLMDIDTTLMDTTRYYQGVTGAYIDTNITEAWVNAADTVINAQFNFILPDTTVLVNNPLLAAVSYAVFENPSTTSDKYFYLSWDLTEENLSAYINLRIFRKDGTALKLVSNAMDLETIAGCAETVDLGSKEEVYPKIRARYEYEMGAGQYLIQFTVSKPDAIPEFRVVVF